MYGDVTSFLMARNNEEQKRIESWFLNAARNAGIPIPSGEVLGENPDFRFQTESGALGIEVTEVLRPANSNHGILPVEEENFHREIIETARRAYYAGPNPIPVRLNVYFTNTRGKKRRKIDMALTLTEFVQANVHRADPYKTFMRDEAPDGFDSVVSSLLPIWRIQHILSRHNAGSNRVGNIVNCVAMMWQVL